MWTIILMQIVGTLFEALGRLIGGSVGMLLAGLHAFAGFALGCAWPFYAGGLAVMKFIDLFLGFLS